MRVRVLTDTSLVWRGGWAPVAGHRDGRLYAAEGPVQGADRSGLLGEGRADGGHESDRVHGGGRGVVTEVHLEVDVRSAGVAAAAGDTDGVAGGDLLADVHVGLDELVAVAGDDAAG